MSHSTIELPWGRNGSLPLNLPHEWSVETSWPDLSGAIDDYSAALHQALDQPEGDVRLESLIHENSKVAIVVDDPTRWTPISDVLPVVLDRLDVLGVKREQICINFGVGRHHAVDDAAMRKRVGDTVVDSYRCYSPPVDDLSHYMMAKYGATFAIAKFVQNILAVVLNNDPIYSISHKRCSNNAMDEEGL